MLTSRKMSKILWKELLIKFNNSASEYKTINEEELLEIDSKNFSKNENEKALKISANSLKKTIQKPQKKPPIRPILPQNDECCGQGCQRCIFDIYYDKLEKYEFEIDEYNKQKDLNKE